MPTKERIDYQVKYRANKYDTIVIYIPKGDKERLKEQAKIKGYKSISSYIQSLIEKDGSSL